MKNESEPEFAVSREVLSGFTKPPFSKSTFYELAAKGMIVRLKNCKGKYKLNESLKRLGLKPVSQLPESPSQREMVSTERAPSEAVIEVAYGLGEREIAQVVLHLLMPDDMLLPGELLECSFTEEQVAEVGEIYHRLLPLFQALESREAKMSMAQGIIDAAYMAPKLS